MQLFRVVSIPQAGDGHGPKAKGVRGPRKRTTDPRSGVGRKLVRVAGPRGVRGRHRPDPRATAPVDCHPELVRAVLEER